MKTQNSVSRTIRILHKINIKKNIFTRNVRLLKSMFISNHSIFGWASFCMNFGGVAWRQSACGTAQGNGSPGCFDIAAFGSFALLGLVSLIFLSTIAHIFSMAFRSGEFAGQSSTVTPWSLNQLLVPLAVWAGAKSCWKMKSASPFSIKLVSRRKH